MEQSTFFQQPLWSVTQLTRYLRDLLESDELLQDLQVQGEVSNLSRPVSGHIYFTLKDANASLRCVMWKPAVLRLSFVPKEGMAIEAHGNLSIYETGGQYQLYVDRIKPAGEGALFQEFLRLKSQLEQEGLFDPTRKRSIPIFPRRIGIITSTTAAALRDILHTIQRRWPPVEVFISPTPVQGIEAPKGIIDALQKLNELVQPDVIILARGGGSIEDLWAFNDESVARAIAASHAPVISGIGHETDFTIADFVSDQRAATPTAAAEIATPDRTDLFQKYSETEQRLRKALQSFIILLRQQLKQTYTSFAIRSPAKQIQTERQRLDEIDRRAGFAIDHSMQLRRAQVHGFVLNLASLNPKAVLERGYAVIKSQADEIISTIRQIKLGKEISIQLHDGEFPAIVSGEPNPE